jgi:ATPase subunit of ABC transporter with duplicated ATPase domains
MPIVSALSVGKSFGAERIFEDVSFQIDEHDRIGLVGPNGAGKTTLLNLLAGREEADEGNIALARDMRKSYSSAHILQYLTQSKREMECSRYFWEIFPISYLRWLH